MLSTLLAEMTTSLADALSMVETFSWVALRLWAEKKAEIVLTVKFAQQACLLAEVLSLLEVEGSPSHDHSRFLSR